MIRWQTWPILLLLLAIAGCQAAPKLSESAPKPVQLAAAAEAPASPPQAIANRQIGLATFAQAEPLPPPPEASAIGQGELWLAEAEALAFQNNPTLASAAARIDMARGEQIQAGLFPNPVIGYHASEVGNQNTAGGQGGFISQRFITGGKLRLDQAMEQSRIDETQFQLQAQEQRVLSDVRVRFYETLLAQRRVQLAAELVQIGDRLVQASRTLLTARQASENDLLQAEIRAEEARIQFDNARNESVEGWRRLAAVIGHSNLEMKRLAGEPDSALPLLQWDACYEMLLESHPQINAAYANAERARLAIDRARREPIPNVDLFVSMRHQNITGSDVANIQIGVPLPLFDKNQGNILSAEAEWMAAANEVDRIRLELQDRLAVAYRRYANARQQVARYGERIVPKAKRSLELVAEGYERGQVQYLTLLTAQQTFVEVSLSHLDAVRELRVAAAIMEGQLLTGSLDARP